VAARTRSGTTVELGLDLLRRGRTADEVAAACGIAVSTAYRWRQRYLQQGMPRSVLEPCPVCEGGQLAKGAYAELLGIYLGDGSIARTKNGSFLLALFQDSRYPGLIERWARLIDEVRPGGHPHTRLMPGATVVAAAWKHWPCLFPQHGPGRKHERPIVLADWQEQIVDAQPERLLRGLFHSDGCRVINWTVRPVAGGPKRYEYGRYFFTNESSDIMRIATDALDRLAVPWRKSNRNTISVARREGVAALDRFVGPKY
jgi:hypothetical protein